MKNIKQVLNIKNIKSSINFKLIFLAILLFNFKIGATDWTITQAGNYKLGYDISSTGDANGTIRIQASYVNLDLNGLYIQQSDSTNNCTGILIDSNLTNINIKNGIVYNYTGTGIAIQPGCQKIVIDNVILDTCKVVGIGFNGTSANPILDSRVQNCRILRCCNTATSVVSELPPLWLSNCTRCYAGYTTISLSGSTGVTGPTNTYGCVQLDRCSKCLVENINMYDNLSFGGVVLNVSGGIGCTGCIIQNCILSGAANGFVNFTVSGGFSVQNGSSNLFCNCIATNNSVTNTAGFFNTTGSGQASNNVFQGCKSLRNTSFGGLVCFISSDTCVTFVDCMSTNNLAATTYTGFKSSSNNCTFLRCIANNNVANGGVGQGLEIAGSNNEVKDCDFYNNAGNTNANSYGIRVTSGSDNLFLRNTSFSNGLTAAAIDNQLSGLPIGSMTTPGGGGAGSASTRISSAMSPWTNLRITN